MARMTLQPVRHTGSTRHGSRLNVLSGTVSMLALVGVALAPIVAYGEATLLTVDANTPGLSQGTFLGTSGGLWSTGGLSGSSSRNYVSVFFVPPTTRTYTLGQASAPVDTVMILTQGVFDPLTPATGALVVNDDSNGQGIPGITMGSCGTPTFCPKISLELTAGTRYSVVITTYSAGAQLGLPQSFYVDSDTGFTAEPPPPPPPQAGNIVGSTTMSAVEAGTTLPVFAGGTLVANGGTITRTFTIQGVGGTLDQGGTHTIFSGVFSDASPGTPGSLVITNSGTGGQVVMSGINTFTGTTTIDPGATLAIDGSLAGAVVVNGGGMLRGTGSFGGGTINAGGILAPGNSPGTLISTGAVTLSAGSITQFDIDGTGTGNGAGNFSRLIVTGTGSTLTAGGQVAPVLRGISGAANNTFTPVVGQAFRVIEAQDGVQGSFAGVTQPTAGLAANTRFDVIYRSNSIDLVVTPDRFGAVADWSSPMGAALDAVRPAAGTVGSAAQMQVFGTLYGMSSAQILQAQRQLTPIVYADALSAQRSAFQAATGSVGGELSARRGGASQAGGQSVTTTQGTTFWMQGSGAAQRTTNGPGNTPGSQVQSGGATVGVDAPLLPGLRLGVAAGVAHQVVRAGNGGQQKGEVGHLTAYGSYSLGIGFVDAQASVMGAQGKATRPMGTFGVMARGETGSLGAGGQVKGGVRVSVQGWQIEPSVAISALRLHQGGLNEYGAGVVGANVARGELTSLQSMVGVRVDRAVALGDGLRLVGSVSAAWAHEMGDERARVSGRLSGLPGAGFAVMNAGGGRDAVVTSAQAVLETQTPLQLFVAYSNTSSTRTLGQAVTAGLRYSW